MPINDPLRLVFAGTTDFAARALNGLIQSAKYPLLAVLTQPDRRAGRGRKMQQSPVKQLAVEHGIPMLQPATLKPPFDPALLGCLAPDLLLVAAYGLIIPSEILEIPKHGCLNIHASCLPRWRGAAPIERAIIHGDQHTGVTIMRVIEALDAGPIVTHKNYPIDAHITGGELHERLARLGTALILEVLEQGTPISATPQDNSQASYAAKITKQDLQLNWQLDAVTLVRRIRAFNPKPLARGELGGREYLILAGEALPDDGTPPGTVRRAPDNHRIWVGTGHGLLAINTLQIPGKRPVSARDFLNGHRDFGQPA